jgi:hypothetical protein
MAKMIAFLCQTERSKIRVGYKQERGKERARLREFGDSVGEN